MRVACVRRGRAYLCYLISRNLRYGVGDVPHTTVLTSAISQLIAARGLIPLCPGDLRAPRLRTDFVLYAPGVYIFYSCFIRSFHGCGCLIRALSRRVSADAIYSDDIALLRENRFVQLFLLLLLRNEK